MDRPHERILGTVLVGLGIALLLVAFGLAYGFLVHPASSSGASSGPEAGFAYSVSGLTVTLTDRSTPGGAAISSTYWAFADGNSSANANVSHTYARAGTYNVSLIVEDKNGAAAESNAALRVGPGATGTGVGSPSFSPGGSVGSVLGSFLGGSLSGVVSLAERFVLLTILWLVGASILKAGWNLITPKAETIQVRVKPRSLAIEPVAATPPSPVAGTRPASPGAPGPAGAR